MLILVSEILHRIGVFKASILLSIYLSKVKSLPLICAGFNLNSQNFQQNPQVFGSFCYPGIQPSHFK